jgi:hypothetical protein
MESKVKKRIALLEVCSAHAVLPEDNLSALNTHI